MRLYDQVDALLIAYQWLDEHAEAIDAAGGEIPPALEEVMDAALAGVENKIEQVVKAEREMAALAKAAKEEAGRIAKTAKTYARRHEWMKNYLAAQTARAGLARHQTPIAKMGHYHSGSPSVKLVSTAIPSAFRRVKEELDGTRAHEALKAAGLLPAKESKDGVPVVSGRTIPAGTKIEVEGQQVVLDAPLRVEYGTYFRVW